MTTYYVDVKAKGKGDHSSPDNAGTFSTVWGKLKSSVAVENSTEWGLSTTEEDMCAEADVDLIAKISDAVESSVNGALLPLDGSAAAVTAILNFRTLGADDHGATADVLTVSGTITIVWTILGND